MQIREQGQQVQLIRSPYDSEKKRCVQKVIHTFKKRHSYSSDDVNEYLSAEKLSELSDSEIKTLSEWLRAKSDKESSDRRRSSIICSAIKIAESSAAIESDGVSAEKALSIWLAMEKMAKVLKKSGHPRSAFKPTATPVATVEMPGQLALE